LTSVDSILAAQADYGNRRVLQMLGRSGPSSGAPIDPTYRGELEQRFGQRFDDVRVHTDPAAAASAQAIGARAYTADRDIVFGPGQPGPGTVVGRRLLTHELAHVVQQSRGPTSGTVGHAGDDHERAASAAVHRIGAGQSAGLAPTSSVPAVQRDEVTAPADADATTDAPTRSPAPVLTPPEIPPETDEERLNRMLAEDARAATAGRGGPGSPSAPPPSETSLAAALQRLLARCEADRRMEGTTRPTGPAPGAGVSRIDTSPTEEIKRRIEACLDTPESQQVKAMAKEILFSRRNTPITVLAYLASLAVGGPTPPIPIRLGDDLELSLQVSGPLIRREWAVTATFTARGSWAERAARGLWGGITSVGRAIGGAASAVGGAIATGARAVGGAVATGVRAVGGAIGAGARAVANAAVTSARAVGSAARFVGGALWSGLKAVGRGIASVGRAVWSGLKAVGRRIATVAGAIWNGVTWVATQLWDKVLGVLERTLHWVMQLPARVGRLLLGLWEAVKSLRPWSLDWWRSLGDASTWTGLLKWLGARLIDLLEIAGVGEAYETAMDFLKFTTRTLTDDEVASARGIFGRSINLRLVRLDEHAVLGPSWSRRDYTSFHTINSWGTSSRDVLIHELTHVWQYERAGAIYMPQAIHAQVWGGGYDYGGVAGLQARQAAGQGFASFNREQQAQIVQDFFSLTQSSPDIALYATFVKEVSTLTEAELIAARPP
jgi:hypothetical protein